MSNIIISKQHQAAPAVDLSKLKSAGGEREWWKSYDAELDGLVDQSDTSHLARLDKSPEQTVEMALEEHETSCAAARKQQWEGQERWQGKENEAMRRGRVMHPYAFMKALQRAGVDARIDEPPQETIWMEKPEGDGVEQWQVSRSNCRLWLNNWTRGGLIGINAWMPNPAAGQRTPRTVTTIQYPYAQEFSVMHFDRHNVPTKEKFRGWRTTLLVLITAGAVTEAEAVKAFGEPLANEASAFYREQLQKHRPRTMGMVQ